MRVRVDRQETRLGARRAAHRSVVRVVRHLADDECGVALVARRPEAKGPQCRCREPMVVPALVLLVLATHVFVVVAGEQQHRDRPMCVARRIGHRALDVHVHRGDRRPIAGGAERQHAAGRKAGDGNAARVDRQPSTQRIDERGEEPDVVDVLLLRGTAARAGIPRQPEAAEPPGTVRRRENDPVPVGHGVHLRLADDVGAVVVVPVEEDDERIAALRGELRRKSQVEAAVEPPHADRVARRLSGSSTRERMVRLERCAGSPRNEQEDARARRTGHLRPASERIFGTRHISVIPGPAHHCWDGLPTAGALGARALLSGGTTNAGYADGASRRRGIR